MSEEPEKTKPPGRRRWLRRMLVGLVVLLMASVWLDQYGARWLGALALRRVLEDAGFGGKFELTGSLRHGLQLETVDLSGKGSLANLTVERVTPDYRWREIFQSRRLRGIRIERAHLDFDLLQSSSNSGSKAFDAPSVAKRLQAIGARLRALDIQIDELTVTVRRGEVKQLELSSSALHHESNSELFQLAIGTMKDASGRQWPAQQVPLTWSDEALSLAKISPLPRLNIENLKLSLLASEPCALSAGVRWLDAAFRIRLDQQSTGIDQWSGHLSLTDAMRALGRSTPVEGVVTAVSLRGGSVLGDWKQATGAIDLRMEAVRAGGASFPELVLHTSVSGAVWEAALRGQLGDSPLELQASAPLDRETGTLGKIDFSINLQRTLSAVHGLTAKPQAPEQSEITLEVAGTCDPAASWAVAANLEAKPERESAPGAWRGNLAWRKTEGFQAKLVARGMEAQGGLTPDHNYRGQVDLTDDAKASLRPWLAAFGIRIPDQLGGSLRWQGEGSLAAPSHRGEAVLDGLSWQHDSQPPVAAHGAVRYQWPRVVETRGLQLTTLAQKVTLDARMEDGQLLVEAFEWRDQGEVMAKGAAMIPVPTRQDVRGEWLEKNPPVKFDLTSEWIPLAKLQPWLPSGATFDAASRAKLEIHLAGNAGEPLLSSTLEIQNLRGGGQTKAPPIDVKLRLTGGREEFRAVGEVSAPDFPPAKVEAALPWHVRQWIEQPRTLLDEPIKARAGIPRIELTRFAPLVPSLAKLTGIVTGDLTVDGTLREPKALGNLALRNGVVGWKNRSVPDIEKIDIDLKATPQRIELNSLNATMAGGGMRGRGNVVLERGKEPQLDVDFTADHLPLLRNDAWIVRANAALNAKGPWATARISGRIDVVDSLFFRDIELLPIGVPFNTPTQPKLPKLDARARAASFTMPKPFGDWTLAVTAATGDPFLIRGNLARGRVDGSIQIGGTLATPAPNGTLVAQDVTARLPFSTLEVRRGMLRFTPESGFDPVLEMRGASTLRPYEVEVYAYGRASDPQLVLTSNPPLPENEILTLLATGTTSRELENADSASSRAVQLLIEEIRRGRLRYGRKLLPLLQMFDRVDFRVDEQDPYSGERYTTATVELDDRWLLSAGFNQAGGSRGMIIYRLRFR